MAAALERAQYSLFANTPPNFPGEDVPTIPARAFLDGRNGVSRSGRSDWGPVNGETYMSQLQSENRLKILTDKLLTHMFHYDTQSQVLALLKGVDVHTTRGLNPEIVSLFHQLETEGLTSDSYFGVLENIAASGLLDEGISLGKLSVPPMRIADPQTGRVIKTPRAYPDLITFQVSENLPIPYHHKLHNGLGGVAKKLAHTSTFQTLLQNPYVTNVTITEIKININDKQRGLNVAHREIRGYKTLIEELVKSNVGIGMDQDFIDQMLSKLQYRVLLANHDQTVIVRYDFRGQLIGSEVIEEGAESQTSNTDKNSQNDKQTTSLRIPEKLDPINIGTILENYEAAKQTRQAFRNAEQAMYVLPELQTIQSEDRLISEFVGLCRGRYTLHIYPNAYRVVNAVSSMVFEFPNKKKKSKTTKATEAHTIFASSPNSFERESMSLDELPEICRATGLSLRQVLWRLIGGRAQNEGHIQRHEEKWVLSEENN